MFLSIKSQIKDEPLSTPEKGGEILLFDGLIFQAAGFSCGNVKKNVAPLPASLFTQTSPPCACTMCFTIKRPRLKRHVPFNVFVSLMAVRRFLARNLIFLEAHSISKSFGFATLNERSTTSMITTVGFSWLNNSTFMNFDVREWLME